MVGLGGAASIALAVALAFFFGYLLTLIPLFRSGLAVAAALPIALAADTLSIATMEFVDNAILLLWPGAMDACLGDLLFWGSLAIALAVAWGPTFLVNRALISRGQGARSRACAPPSRGEARPRPYNYRRRAGRGSGSGVSTGSICARRCSNAGGRTRLSPRCS